MDRRAWWVTVHRVTKSWTQLSPSTGEGNGTPLQYSCLENPMDREAWRAAVHGVAKSQTQLSDFTFTFHFHALKKEMAIHSSVLAWRIPGTGEPGGLPSMGSHRVGHNWSNLAAEPEHTRYTPKTYKLKILSKHQGNHFLDSQEPFGIQMCTPRDFYLYYSSNNLQVQGHLHF